MPVKVSIIGPILRNILSLLTQAEPRKTPGESAGIRLLSPLEKNPAQRNSGGNNQA